MPQPAAISSTLSADEDSLPSFMREGIIVDCRIRQIGSLFRWAEGESIVTILRFDMVLLLVVVDDDGLLDVVI